MIYVVSSKGNNRYKELWAIFYDKDELKEYMKANDILYVNVMPNDAIYLENNYQITP